MWSGGSSSGTSVRVDQTTRRHIVEARSLAVNGRQVTFKNITQRVSLVQGCSKPTWTKGYTRFLWVV
jgi:hypothetical protein